MYKKGDKVRVRSDLVEGHIYYMLLENGERGIFSDCLVHQMLKFLGKVVTIKSAGDKYLLEETGWWWTDEMFEGLVIDAEPVLSEPTKSSLNWELANLF